LIDPIKRPPHRRRAGHGGDAGGPPLSVVPRQLELIGTTSAEIVVTVFVLGKLPEARHRPAAVMTVAAAIIAAMAATIIGIVGLREIGREIECMVAYGCW
jgi:hypothetical protein